MRSTTGWTARAEAARCLDCHTYCSLCVGVCPNLALQTIRVQPFAARLPALECADGAIRARQAWRESKTGASKNAQHVYVSRPEYRRRPDDGDRQSLPVVEDELLCFQL